MSQEGVLIGVIAAMFFIIVTGIRFMAHRLWVQGVAMLMVGSGTPVLWILAARAVGPWGFVLAIVIWCLACITIAMVMAKLCDYFTGSKTSLFTL